MAERARTFLFGIAGLFLTGAAAYADNEPVIVVPGRPGAPVIIHGVDATGAVIYGDWGLYRPGSAVVIEGGIWPPAWAPPLYEPPHYFPATGRTPAYGRKEIDPGPHRRGLVPEYHKSWQTESQPGPVTEYPPFAPPGVVCRAAGTEAQGARRTQVAREKFMSPASSRNEAGASPPVVQKLPQGSK